MMKETLRVMSYNVHGCVGTDRKLDPERIAEAIIECKPDVVALQELDLGRTRSGGLDQAKLIAERVSMAFHFYPAFRVKDEQYGDAILSRFPMQVRRTAILPTAKSRLAFEPRGALWASIQMENGELQLTTTHLGLSRMERANQVEALLGPEWLGHADCRQRSIFCGDLNALPRSRVYQALTLRLQDAHLRAARRWGIRTYPSAFPLLRLDYIFTTRDIVIESATVCSTPLSRMASDHLPVIADLSLVSDDAH